VADYIIMGFEATEEYPLGAFRCQPVDSKVRDERMIAFAQNSNQKVSLYFDPELLDYILSIDENKLDAPYKPLDGSF